MPTGIYAQSDESNYRVGSIFGVLDIYLDRVPGGQATHDIIQGWGITRLATIAGFDFGGVAPTVPAVLNAAVKALVEVVGERGSPCPDIDVGTYLEQFLPEMVSTDVVTIRIVYKGYPTPTFEFAGSLSQVESNLDKDGNLITVEYTYPKTYMLDPRKAGLKIIQGGMVTRPVPEPIFIIKYTVTAGTIGGARVSATDIVSYNKAMYEGTINLNTYQIGLMSADPLTLMIDSINGVSRDGGFTYESTWTFHLRPGGWDPLVVFINPDDGKPPPDLIIGTGSKIVPVPRRTTFPGFVFGPN